MQLEASRTTKAPLSLQLPEGAHFALGGEQLRVSGFNLTLRSTGTGAHIDGEHLSRLLLVEGGAAVQLHNLHLVNGGGSLIEPEERITFTTKRCERVLCIWDMIFS